MPNILKVYLENGQTKAFRFETSTTVKVTMLGCLPLFPPPEFNPVVKLHPVEFAASWFYWPASRTGLPADAEHTGFSMLFVQRRCCFNSPLFSSKQPIFTKLARIWLWDHYTSGSVIEVGQEYIGWWELANQQLSTLTWLSLETTWQNIEEVV